MRTGLLRTDLSQIGQRRFAKRSTGGCEQDTSHTYLRQATGIIAGQTLEDCVVLAVDRQQYGTAALHGLHKQGARHDQRLFIGQQHLLARLNRRQGRAQTRRADNRGHHGIDLRGCRHLAQSGLAFEYFGGRACS
ncbi:hypothetical protein D3C78_1100180 [compost metagenome]